MPPAATSPPAMEGRPTTLSALSYHAELTGTVSCSRQMSLDGKILYEHEVQS